MINNDELQIKEGILLCMENVGIDSNLVDDKEGKKVLSLMDSLQYISFIADHRMWYEPSLELERRMNTYREEFVLSKEKKQLEDLLNERDKAYDVKLYYDELSKKIATMKWNYREMITEP